MSKYKNHDFTCEQISHYLFIHEIDTNKNNWVRIMVFNTTFYNISVILWQLALLVEKTRVPGEDHRPVVSH